jgi:hypothetical protein
MSTPTGPTGGEMFALIDLGPADQATPVQQVH